MFLVLNVFVHVYFLVFSYLFCFVFDLTSWHNRKLLTPRYSPPNRPTTQTTQTTQHPTQHPPPRPITPPKGGVGRPPEGEEGRRKSEPPSYGEVEGIHFNALSFRSNKGNGRATDESSTPKGCGTPKELLKSWPFEIISKVKNWFQIYLFIVKKIFTKFQKQIKVFELLVCVFSFEFLVFSFQLW